MSLLGKGLLLLQPAEEHDPVLVQTAQQAAEARAAIVAAPGLAASMRAQTQAYEELRWFTFFLQRRPAGRSSRCRNASLGW